MTVDRVIDQPRKYSTLFLPTNEMYPCSVAEKRANVWVGGETVADSGDVFDFHRLLKKIEL